jgi:hypothetical protein
MVMTQSNLKRGHDGLLRGKIDSIHLDKRYCSLFRFEDQGHWVNQARRVPPWK